MENRPRRTTAGVPPTRYGFESEAEGQRTSLAETIPSILNGSRCGSIVDDGSISSSRSIRTLKKEVELDRCYGEG